MLSGGRQAADVLPRISFRTRFEGTGGTAGEVFAHSKAKN